MTSVAIGSSDTKLNELAHQQQQTVYGEMEEIGLKSLIREYGHKLPVSDDFWRDLRNGRIKPVSREELIDLRTNYLNPPTNGDVRDNTADQHGEQAADGGAGVENSQQ